MTRRRGAGLFCGQAKRMDAGQFALSGAFVYGGGNDVRGRDARLRQQRQAARAFAGKHQLWLSGSDR